MTSFIGEYYCKVDSKGRVLLPSAFKKQLNGGAQEKFVIKKDIFESCLAIYPMDEWERQNKIIRKRVNPYNKEHNRFLRRFFKGMVEAVLDSSNRLLFPKRLLDEIGAEKELILAGQLGRIEVWVKDKYESIDMSDSEFESMAENIMDGLNDDPDD